MNRKNQYKDMEKWRRTKNAQCNRYYGKTVCGRSAWNEQQDKMVLQHDMTDHELSRLIQHSVKAIQIRRSRLKRMMAGGSNKWQICNT